MNRASRLAVTFFGSLLLLTWMDEPLPFFERLFFDFGTLFHLWAMFGWEAPWPRTLTAAGVLPMIAAYGVFDVLRSRPGPRRLYAAALAFGVAFAGWAVASEWTHNRLPDVSWSVEVAGMLFVGGFTMVGGTALCLLLAEALDRWGAAAGIPTLLGITLGSWLPSGGPLFEIQPPGSLDAWLVALGFCALAGFLLKADRCRAETASPLAVAPPLVVAAVIVALARFVFPPRWAPDWVWRPESFDHALHWTALCLVATWVIVVWERAGGHRPRLAARLLHVAAFCSVSFAVGALGGTEFWPLPLLFPVGATAWALDLWAELRARASPLVFVGVVPASVPVHQVEVALAEAGIPALVRNRHLRPLLGPLGSWARSDVYVPPEHVASAAALLREVAGPQVAGGS